MECKHAMPSAICDFCREEEKKLKRVSVKMEFYSEEGEFLASVVAKSIPEAEHQLERARAWVLEGNVENPSSYFDEDDNEEVERENE